MLTVRIMNNTRITGSDLFKLILTIGLAVPALAPCATAQSIFNEGKDGLGAPIEGTWIFKLHRVTQGIDFTALQSFTAGGVTLATGTIDRTPAPISPLYGSWRRVDNNRYVATICFFAFDLAGNAVAMIKTNETLQLLDGNNLVGSGTGFACDINGDNCVNVGIAVTFTGSRVVARGATD